MKLAAGARRYHSGIRSVSMDGNRQEQQGPATTEDVRWKFDVGMEACREEEKQTEQGSSPFLWWLCASYSCSGSCSETSAWAHDFDCFAHLTLALALALANDQERGLRDQTCETSKPSICKNELLLLLRLSWLFSSNFIRFVPIIMKCIDFLWILMHLDEFWLILMDLEMMRNATAKTPRMDKNAVDSILSPIVKTSKTAKTKHM